MAAHTEMTQDWIASAAQAVAVTDAEGRVLAVNDAFNALFAGSDPSLRGGPIEDVIIASRYRSAYRAARRQMLTDGPTASVPPSEFVAVRADGGEFAANLSFALTSDVPPHLVTSVRDSTDHPTGVTPMPGALHERAEELAGFGTWEWTRESRRMRWSDNLFRIFGLKPSEITPTPEYVFAHCHPDDRERLERAADELDRTGWHRELRYRCVWPDETVRHLTSTAVSVANPDRGPPSIVGTTQDVTDQHQAQLELAARFAVSDALSLWEPGAASAERLVRDLAEALELDAGMMWIPRGDVLVPWVIWQARALYTPERQAALREARIRRGDSLAGSAWLSAEPTRAADLTDEATATMRALEGRTGAHGSLAVPATYGDEVLAILTFASRRQVVHNDQFVRSLFGIGLEIGHFLAQRRGEFCAPVLSPRELEVLQLSATGHVRRQIADEMHLSQATVKTHLEHIYRKLGVVDRASAVAEALRRGLIR